MARPPREYDPLEVALVEKAAREVLDQLNAHHTHRASTYVQHGVRLLRVTVSVVPPDYIEAIRREIAKGESA